MPASADLSEGLLKLSTTSAQSSFITLQEIEDAQFTVNFTVSEIDAMDSIFFYLGDQTVDTDHAQSVLGSQLRRCRKAACRKFDSA